MKREEKDKLVWKASRNGVSSVKSMFFVLESGWPFLLLEGIVWNPWMPSKVSFLCGKLVGNSVDFVLASNSRKRGQYLLFFLFGFVWVLPSTARETLLS